MDGCLAGTAQFRLLRFSLVRTSATSCSKDSALHGCAGRDFLGGDAALPRKYASRGLLGNQKFSQASVDSFTRPYILNLGSAWSGLWLG